MWEYYFCNNLHEKNFLRISNSINIVIAWRISITIFKFSIRYLKTTWSVTVTKAELRKGRYETNRRIYVLAYVNKRILRVNEKNYFFIFEGLVVVLGIIIKRSGYVKNMFFLFITSWCYWRIFCVNLVATKIKYY